MIEQKKCNVTKETQRQRSLPKKALNTSITWNYVFEVPLSLNQRKEESTNSNTCNCNRFAS